MRAGTAMGGAVLRGTSDESDRRDGVNKTIVAALDGNANGNPLNACRSDVVWLRQAFADMRATSSDCMPAASSQHS